MTETAYDDMLEENPWTVMVLALGCQARGEALPKDLAYAVEAGATALAAAALIQAGGDEHAVLRQFEEREFHIKLSYDGATKELGLEIIWDNDEVTDLRATVINEEGS